jgi:hypothetical protein
VSEGSRVASGLAFLASALAVPGVRVTKAEGDAVCAALSQRFTGAVLFPMSWII